MFVCKQNNNKIEIRKIGWKIEIRNHRQIYITGNLTIYTTV